MSLDLFATFGRAVSVSLTVLLVAALTWGVRVDHLRSGYKEALDGVARTVATLTGRKVVAYPLLSSEITSIDMDRKEALGERDNARQVLAVQSESIRQYEAETKRLRAISDDRSALAARLIADRARWIAKAQEASTRVERLSAERELQECEEVLDALYAAGF